MVDLLHNYKQLNIYIMKKFILFAIILLPFLTVNAQMDERFYFPSKKMTTLESVNYIEQFYYIDKDTISSLVLLPKSHTNNTTILYFHGAGGNVTSYVKFVKPLVDNGYKVIMIDFRGYGKSTGKPTHLNIASDAQVLFNSIKNKKEFVNEKIILYGASMGSQVATNLAKNNQEKIKGLVLDGGISSFTNIALEYAPKDYAPIIKQNLISPYSAMEDIKAINSIPVLLIHSKEDKEVSFSNFEIVSENANTNLRKWIYEGDHLMAPVLHEKEFVEKINNLLK